MNRVVDKVVDKAATKAARKRQADGEKRIREFFRLPTHLDRFHRLRLPVVATLDGYVLAGPPVRTNPKCARRRSPAARARHLARKRQTAARKANRR